MELNTLKHEMNIMNKRLNHISYNLKTLAKDSSMETKKKEKETEAQVKMVL